MERSGSNQRTFIRDWRSRIAFDKYSNRGIAIRLFLTCWVIYALHFATNTVREIYPALSLADNLSFDVNEYMGLHPDIFEMPGRGVYINNNPGASLLGALPYALVRPGVDWVTTRVEAQRAASNATPPEYDSVYPLAREFYREAYRRGLDVKFGIAAGVMQAGLMAPVSALSAVVMFYTLLWQQLSRKKALMLALLFAFATPIFYRTAQLNHNLLQAHATFFAFVLLWQPWHSSSRPSPGIYLLAGLLTGFAVVLDYSGLVVVAILGLYAVWQWRSSQGGRQPLLALFAFGLGLAINAAFLMGYQWAAFGHPLLPAQHYMPETTYSGAGYQGIAFPQLDLIWLLTFGMRYGLFTSAPFLALALYVPGWWSRRDRLVPDRELVVILSFTAAFFLFTAANQFSRMQFNTGVRHVVPVTPFLFFLAATVFLRLPRWTAIVVGLTTVYWSWCLAMYRDVELGYGIFESLIHVTTEGVRLPWLTTLEGLGLIPGGWAWLPLLIGIAIVFTVWFVDVDINRPSLKPFLTVRARGG